MAFIIPKKPSSSSSTSLSSYEEDKSLAHRNVSSCLYLKPKRGSEADVGRAFNKEVVLRRIRHRKRVNRVRGLIQSFFAAPQEAGEEEEKADGWMEDAFSSPWWANLQDCFVYPRLSSYIFSAWWRCSSSSYVVVVLCFSLIYNSTVILWMWPNFYIVLRVRDGENVWNSCLVLGGLVDKLVLSDCRTIF